MTGNLYVAGSPTSIGTSSYGKPTAMSLHSSYHTVSLTQNAPFRGGGAVRPPTLP